MASAKTHKDRGTATGFPVRLTFHGNMIADLAAMVERHFNAVGVAAVTSIQVFKANAEYLTGSIGCQLTGVL